ncbi:fimbria/pilus outer membrane usher protein [Stenotrophomonas sp.]|uniref:fimbria/pilus outer membrane usher protein n=1 Tax=Stenotrophomonas sp. TaxID=69392 RepID=UPI0028B1B2AB|nr:fimbria/pilus outer membrane usher protein [Stenotrophomonas sp.]
MLGPIPDTKRRARRVPRLAPLAVAFNALGIGGALASPQFNLDFLRGNTDQRDVAALSSPGAILPGTYPFAVYLNGNEVAREDVTFTMAATGQAEPCLSHAQLTRWGVDLAHADAAADACQPLATRIVDAGLSYNGNQQRLDLRIPQVNLINLPRGHIPRALRDQGINALLIDYALSGAHNKQRQQGRDNYFFASVNSTLNAGMWRFRHTASANRSNGNKTTRWRSQGFLAETDLGSSHSRLVLGDTYTAYGVFDSIRFRGAQISNDDEMLPYSQRSYAPVVRGVAASAARVEVRQDGRLIHALNVAPGAFQIDDIVPNRLSGELDVSIIEADGSRQRYKQSFSAVETMLRPGLFHYELSAGELRNGYEHYRPRFVQASAAKGLASDITPYAGLLLSEQYSAVALGAAQSLGRLGSASIDISHARTRLAQGGTSSGQSVRFLYSKSLNTHGTEFRLVGHRYSTSGYYDFSDASAEHAQWQHGYYETSYEDPVAASDFPTAWQQPQQHPIRSQRFHNKRNRLEIALNQRISDTYSLSASYNNQNYWGTNTRERELQLGLNGQIGAVNFGTFFRHSQGRYRHADRSFGLTLSLPLDRLGPRRTSGSASYSHSRYGGASYQSGINGTLLDRDRLSYGVSVGKTDAGNVGSANLRYAGSKGVATIGATHASAYSQINWGLRGGWVLHRDGLTFAQSLHRTNVLVHARDGAGLGLENQSGVRLDRRGYGLVSGISAYRLNHVALRTDDLGADIDASRISRNIVPTRGALARVDFETRRGLSVMIHPILIEDIRVPLGATVFGNDGLGRGIAGPNGEIFVSGVHPGERLSVRWGVKPDQRCEMQLGPAQTLEADRTLPGYRHIELHCLPPGQSIKD